MWCYVTEKILLAPPTSGHVTMAPVMNLVHRMLVQILVQIGSPIPNIYLLSANLAPNKPRFIRSIRWKIYVEKQLTAVTQKDGFLQRGRIACNAERCNTYSNSVRLSVCLSVCPSVTRWYPIQTNEHRITRSSL